MGSGGPTTGDDGLDAPPERTDLELLQAFRAGDVGVFSVLYERHRPAAMRFARGLAANEFAANDAVSDAFLRVYSALTKGDGPVDGFRAYLYTAIRSAVVDDIRRTSRMSYTDDLEPYEDSTEPVDVAEVQEDREFIFRAFAGLTDQWKQVLWLTSVEGRRHNEVANMLGLKANAVAALALRAREGLRQNYLTAHLSTTETRDECRRTVKHLAALVRARISPREKAHAEDHLRGCRRCRVAAIMLTDLNRVMPAIAIPALLAPAPWLVRLHAVTAGTGSVGAAAHTTGSLSAPAHSPGSTGPVHASGSLSPPAHPTGSVRPDVSRPEVLGRGTRHPGRHTTARHTGRRVRSRSVRRSNGLSGRAASFVAAHTVAVVAGVLVALTAGGIAVAAAGGKHTAARPAAAAPRALVSSATPTPSPTSAQVSTSARAARSTPAPKRPSTSAGRSSPRPSPNRAAPGSFVPTTPAERMANAVLQSLDSARAGRGLAPLQWLPPLERAAIAHNDAMIATHTFGHQVSGEPDFSGRLNQQGVSCSAAAENIASTQDLTTAGAVAEEQRMADERPPGTTVHADNILNPAYTEVGIAVGIDTTRKVLLITEDFCLP